MNKHFLTVIVLIFSIHLMAEDIPNGYYTAIDGKQDSVLKSTLSLIIRGGERYEYGPTTYHTSSNPPEWEVGDPKYGTWQAFPLTDRQPDGTIWDTYSHCVRYYPKQQGESGCSLNIEHCLPKSWWGWTQKDTRDTSWLAYKDIYNLNPSDAQANSNKSNYAPGHVQKGDKFDNGSFKMDAAKSSRYGYICFEPEAQYRGDFARAYFYMVTAYENLIWNSTYSAYVNHASYLMFSDSITQVLLDWHRADPVSDKERCRMDHISDIQGNRNPYIDYPELVEYIWGNQKGQAVHLSELTCAFVSGVCPDPVVPEPPAQPYDTLINLPALTKNIVNAYNEHGIVSFASEKIQSNGTAAITMGASTTDGYIQFSNLALQDSAILVFRASVYNTAGEMQLEVYANDVLIQTIAETVVQNTRNEVRYRVTVPAGTDRIKLLSVGGKTTKRACMQELYLLCPKAATGLTTPEQEPSARKQIRNGQVVIERNGAIFSTFGQQIR